MLLRVTISNFLSFYDEVTFDMFPSRQRKSFMNHVYNDKRVPLLKMGAVYGANNAGKSNFVKAIKLVRNVVLREKYLTADSYDDFRYQLVEKNTVPISIELEFYRNSQYYIYSLKIDRQLHEKLLVSGVGEEEDRLVYQRDGIHLVAEDITASDIAEELLKKNPFSSVLPLNRKFPVLKSQHVETAYDWFEDGLLVLDINSSISNLIMGMSSNPSLLEFSNNMIKSLGVSDALSIKQTDFEQWLDSPRGKKFPGMSTVSDGEGEIMASKDKRNEFHLTMKEGKRIVSEFMFRQQGPKGMSADMDIDTQSDGTVRLLTLLPAFYTAIYKESIVFIDEIENSMHPNLIYRLVKHFASTPSKGQLVFTTHLTRFQNQQDLMRVDEIWEAEKTHGVTTLKSFNDFKIHNTINVENGYILGRFGGVPTINL